MKRRLLAAKERTTGMSLEDVCAKQGDVYKAPGDLPPIWMLHADGVRPAEGAGSVNLLTASDVPGAWQPLIDPAARGTSFVQDGVLEMSAEAVDGTYWHIGGMQQR